MNTPNPPDNYEILPADFLRKHGEQKEMKFRYRRDVNPIADDEWDFWRAVPTVALRNAHFDLFDFAAPVGTMARVLAESGEPVAPASETDTPLTWCEYARDLQSRLDAAEARVDRIAKACGFPTVEDREQLTETIIKRIVRKDVELAASEAGAAALRDALVNAAQKAYVDAVQMAIHDPLTKGEDHHIAKGTFTKERLKAFEKMASLYGEHYGIHRVLMSLATDAGRKHD